MQKLLLSALAFLLIFSCSTEKRASPPMNAKGTIAGTSIEVQYGAPSVKGRKVFGELVPYGTIWRTGANENTRIALSADMLIANQALPAGSYGLLTTPGETTWKVHFNAQDDAWGAYSYDSGKDVLVVECVTSPLSDLQEQMLFEVKEDGLHLKWEFTHLFIPMAPAP